MTWDHDYIVTSPYSPEEKVLCMRCGMLVADHTYVERPKINSPGEIILVYASRKMSHYRQIPVLTVKQEDDGPRASLTHLIVCQDCEKCDLEPADLEKIIKQIINGLVAQARWAGMPEEAAIAIERKWADTIIERRLFGEELISSYQRRR